MRNENREFHILIAEQVMGWKVETAPDGTDFLIQVFSVGKRYRRCWNP